ncbi:helix-turn-helix domain-containing protein [Haladaptatus sp. CMAA 1911]|uniref:AlbA family DNA-binding domain-containing protein n=1 Tax=unclassified Haladaptatus TaxID=2622732 RepID=UPI0037541A2F
MIIEKSLEDITLDDIHQLVDEEVQEGKEIEYKEFLDLDKDDHKEKLLGEVTSFANSRGGDLIVGVPDDQGTPRHVGGMPVQNLDSMIERWSNTTRRGADPKLPPSIFDIKELHIKDDRYVFVIRVNKSWNPLHRVTYNNKFYGRGPSGKFPLDTGEIQRRMLEAEQFEDDLEEFRDERISEFETGDTLLPVINGPKLLLHLVPVGAFSPGQKIDRKTAGTMYKNRPQMLASRPVTGGFTDNYAVDSVIVHQSVPDGGLYEYVRTFSSGTIEMYTAWPFNPTNDESAVLNVDMVQKALESTLPIQLQYLDSQNIDPPIYACMSILDADGYGVDTGFTRRQQWTLDSAMQLPEVMIESYDTDLENVCDQLVEYIYNTGGQAGPNSKVYE